VKLADPCCTLAVIIAVSFGAVPRDAAAQVATQQESALSWRIPELSPPEQIRAEEFAARRKAYVDSLGEGVYLVLGARAPSQDYLPYQQNPEFRYLTGIEEPDAALVLVRSGGRMEERLFILPRNPSREVWEGARLGPEGARALTRIASEPTDRLVPVLDSLLQKNSTLVALATPPTNVRADQELNFDQEMLGRLIADHANVTVKQGGRVLSALRAKKSPAELDRLRRATYISAEAHRQAMAAAEPGMNEFEIRALVEYFFVRNGGDGPAYASIVGSGPNSTTLHYNEADRCMNNGEVLLFDVASYFAGYASDVTRTIPVNGKFTPEQRAIYETVLAAQKAAERQIRQGATWAQLNQAASTELANGLARIGLIDAPDATYDCGTPSQPRKCPQLRLFYMHGLGHGVGLEVHDPDISTTGGFQPGSAVTIEPGIYVRSDAFDYLSDSPANRAMVQRLRPVLERHANIGVRIEDVYIFDANGVERASRGAPREIAEVEALMKDAAAAVTGRRGDVVGWRCPRVRT
jgi:Xaa-Pro aminopeptidase